MSQNDAEDSKNDIEQYPKTDDGYPLIPVEDVVGVFPHNTRWGYRITFEDYDERKVHGHITPRASDGDLFAYQLESGRIGVFALENVDNCLDPSDMFFADARDVGYLQGYSKPRDSTTFDFL